VEKVARWKWHVRGNWNPREDRTPSAVWLGILWIGMLFGFGLDAERFLGQHPPMLLHLHAAVFTIWMFLITAQVLLVVRDRVDLHRKLGWLLVAWACLMAVMGPAAAYTAAIIHDKAKGPSPHPLFAIQAVNIGCFLVLFAIGIAMRKNNAAHKRMMILANVSLAPPGFARLIEYFYRFAPSSPLGGFGYIFYGNIVLIAGMLGWDLYRGRLVRSHVLASIALLTCDFFASVLYFWPPWSNLTLQWVTAWAT
jgi:hypothetical protein